MLDWNQAKNSQTCVEPLRSTEFKSRNERQIFVVVFLVFYSAFFFRYASISFFFFLCIVCVHNRLTLESFRHFRSNRTFSFSFMISTQAQTKCARLELNEFFWLLIYSNHISYTTHYIDKQCVITIFFLFFPSTRFLLECSPVPYCRHRSDGAWKFVLSFLICPFSKKTIFLLIFSFLDYTLINIIVSCRRKRYEILWNEEKSWRTNIVKPKRNHNYTSVLVVISLTKCNFPIWKCACDKFSLCFSFSF